MLLKHENIDKKLKEIKSDLNLTSFSI